MLDAQLIKHRREFTVDVALRVPAGAALGVFGPSGAGKSTVLSCIAGLETPDAGHVRLGDAVFFPPPLALHRRNVGYLTQAADLFPHLTVGENVLFGVVSPSPRGAGALGPAPAACGEAGGGVAPPDRVSTSDPLRHLGADEAPAARAARSGEGSVRGGRLGQDAMRWLAELRSQLGLAPLWNVSAGRISGGQARRVALARMLARRPPLVLLDEPFTGLDRHLVRELLDALLAWRARLGFTLLAVDHQAAVLERLAPRVVVIERGRIVQDATWSEVRAAPATPLLRALLEPL